MERRIGDKCILDDNKICDGCMECDICDLDPNKICDNCGKCLDIRDDAVIRIDRIIMNPNDGKR